MRVSAAIKSLIHGVTTDNLVNADSRYMAEQINTITRPDEGLAKRPPATFVADMGATLATDGTEFVKRFIIHDVAYFITFRADPLTLAVTREDGAVYTVDDIANDTYLDGITEDNVEVAVQGEQVFILNKTHTVAMKASVDPVVTNSMLFIKAPPPQGTKIEVKVTDHTDTRQSVLITVPSSLAGTATDNIAGQINTALNALTNITSTKKGSVVEVLRTDGEYCELTATTDFGDDSYLVVMNGRVNNFSDLPRYSYHGHVTEVLPEGSTDVEPVYMESLAESYKDEIDNSPGAPTPWPTADFIGLSWSWYYRSLLNPTAPLQLWTGALPTNDILNLFYLRHHPTPGTMFIEGKEVAGLQVANYYYGQYGHGFFVNFKTGVGTPATFTHMRIANPADTETTIGGVRDMEIQGTDTMKSTDISSSSFTVDDTINYSVWINEVQNYPSALSGLIQVRWVEALKSGLNKSLDETSMPHLLTPSDTVGTFVYKTPNWDDRRAGSEVTNPIPAFVNTTIEDIIIFQNRLAILSNDEFSASATDNVLNFWRDTVTQLLSKHPINIRSTSKDSSKLRYFVYHNRDLLITAGRQQYKLDGKIPLTPQTAAMQLTTSYNASSSVSPISIGSNVYIPSHQGEYLHISKYEGSNENQQPDSADSITHHVRKYIAGTVKHLQGLPNHGLLFASASDGQELFVCNYDTEKTRTEDRRFAWFKWKDFTDDTTYTIANIATSKNTLVLAINSANGLSLLNMDIDSGSEHRYLDYQMTFTAVNTTVDVTTTYSVSESEIVVVQGAGCPSPGDYVGITSLVAGVITLDTDMAGGTVYVGREFNVQAIPNIVTVRDEGGHVNNAANLRINGFEIRVFNTGKLTATERSPYDTYDTQEFTGLVSGSLDAITDQEATTTDVFKVGFKQHADKGTLLLESKSWLPMTITQIDWRGNYKARGRRF